VTGDMQQKGSQLEKLIGSFKDVADALQSAVVPPPH
jgi:hypothetical protein